MATKAKRKNRGARIIVACLLLLHSALAIACVWAEESWSVSGFARGLRWRVIDVYAYVGFGEWIVGVWAGTVALVFLFILADPRRHYRLSAILVGILGIACCLSLY